MYGVYRSGGRLGELTKLPVYISRDKKDVLEKARRWRDRLTPGDHTYYRIKYTVRKIKEKGHRGNC